MASKQQYDIFKLLFDEESEREKVLHEHSKLYISLTTLYSAFLIFIAKDSPPQHVAQWALFALATLFLVAAFIFSISAAGIDTYEAINDPEDIIKGFGDAPPTDEEFLDQRIVDLTVACNRNSDVNDRKAVKLRWAGWLLLSGIALHATYFLSLAWPGGHDAKQKTQNSSQQTERR